MGVLPLSLLLAGASSHLAGESVAETTESDAGGSVDGDRECAADADALGPGVPLSWSDWLSRLRLAVEGMGGGGKKCCCCCELRHSFRLPYMSICNQKKSHSGPCAHRFFSPLCRGCHPFLFLQHILCVLFPPPGSKAYTVGIVFIMYRRLAPISLSPYVAFRLPACHLISPLRDLSIHIQQNRATITFGISYSPCPATGPPPIHHPCSAPPALQLLGLSLELSRFPIRISSAKRASIWKTKITPSAHTHAVRKTVSLTPCG